MGFFHFYPSCLPEARGLVVTNPITHIRSRDLLIFPWSPGEPSGDTLLFLQGLVMSSPLCSSSALPVFFLHTSRSWITYSSVSMTHMSSHWALFPKNYIFLMHQLWGPSSESGHWTSAAVCFASSLSNCSISLPCLATPSPYSQVLRLLTPHCLYRIFLPHFAMLLDCPPQPHYGPSTVSSAIHRGGRDSE
jgi:hypothetical protein